MTVGIILVVVAIGIALAFDFTNGMHDAANSVSTIVSTGVLSPKLAVIWAAFFNFIAFLIFGTTVAHTIGNGMIDITTVTPYVILAGLIGAISWNLITWYFGIPSSSSHAIIGGYAGAAIAHGGFGAIIAKGWYLTVLFIVLAPLIGLVVGYFLKILTSWLLFRRDLMHVNKAARVLQLFSAATFSLGHGGNDAQKTMGIITGLLFAGGVGGRVAGGTFDIPLWVVLSAHGAIAAGTLTGGWRIIKTMGQKITKLRPIDGFCAETAAASSIFLSTHLGVPVSTTHVITGAIAGVGSVNRLSAVRWTVTIDIVWAWLLTIPSSALIAGFVYTVVKLVFRVS